MLVLMETCAHLLLDAPCVCPHDLRAALTTVKTITTTEPWPETVTTTEQWP